ncbi:MAG: hypothetical protein QW371_06895 [Candidatus Bathyarchaeia archaeon]
MPAIDPRRPQSLWEDLGASPSPEGELGDRLLTLARGEARRPEELYTADDAREALEGALKAHEACERLLGGFR